MFGCQKIILFTLILGFATSFSEAQTSSIGVVRFGAEPIVQSKLLAINLPEKGRLGVGETAAKTVQQLIKINADKNCKRMELMGFSFVGKGADVSGSAEVRWHQELSEKLSRSLVQAKYSIEPLAIADPKTTNLVKRNSQQFVIHWVFDYGTAFLAICSL